MIVTLAFSVVLCAVAAAIILTQLAAYRRARAEPHDLFVFTRRRLHIRIAGAVLLALIGLTFGAWELVSDSMSAATASRLLSMLVAEVVLLFVVAGLDLRETSKTAGRQPHNFDFEELARLRKKDAGK